MVTEDSSREVWLRQARSYLRHADPVLARLIDDRPGFDPRAWMAELPPMDLYGALLFQVTGQQLSVPATRRTLARIQALFGGHLPAPAELLAVDPGQLRPLADRVAHELAPLEGEVGTLGVRLRADRDVLPGGHRGRAGHEARDAGRHNRGAARVGSGNTNDDGRDRDDAVVCAEDGGAQPAGAMAEVSFPTTRRAHHGFDPTGQAATAIPDAPVGFPA